MSATPTWSGAAMSRDNATLKLELVGVDILLVHRSEDLPGWRLCTQDFGSPHPCRTYGVVRPAERLVSTAVGRPSLIRMRSQVQVLAGPPTNPAGHSHAGRSLALALPAVLPGSCHPRATLSGGRVL